MKSTAKVFGLGALTALALSLSLSTAQAQPPDYYPHHHYGWQCREDIRDAERRLDHAIDRFGRDSWQARDARHHLRQVRERCGWDYDHHPHDYH